MADKNIWPAVAAERRALADDLEGLDAASWAKPSLCAGWSVRDVLAHMTASAEITGASFLPKLIGAGFSLNKMSEKDIAERVKGTTADTLARFRSIIDSKKHPPGPIETWLGEAIVHSEDIRRALGIAHAYPTDALIRVADSYKKSNLVMGAKKRIAGLTLKATDASWSTGEGPEVSGPMASLLMVLAGRSAALADLSGPGVETLRARM